MQGAGDDRGAGDDPFTRLDLGEDFVRGATVQEGSAAERIERLRVIDAEHRRLLDERRAALRVLRRRARRARRVRRLVVSAVVVALGIAGGWTLLSGDDGDDLRIRDPGVAAADHATVPDTTTAADAVGSDQFAGETAVATRPSPSAEAGSGPLGAPAPLTVESPAHRFTMRQPSSTEPVAYDPCRPIHVVVNGRTAPAGGDGILAEALAEVSRVSGLQLVLDGPSDEPADFSREAFQPDRYGDRWAPVLVAWSDPGEVADLEGDVAGVGGSAWLEVDRTSRVYVTGLVAIDGPQMAEILSRPGGQDAVEAVILHELGHLLGLDHVDDPGELMQPVAEPGLTAFGPGDLTGLAHLGRGECHPDL